MPISEKEIFTVEFEQAVNAYIDTAIECEKKTFSSTVESFEVHAGKIRARLYKAWRDFRRSYCLGYSTLLDEIESSGESIPSLQTADLQQVSHETLQPFYKAACHLLNEGSYKEAYDAFFFLVTIAPHVREFWLQFGYSALQLDEKLVAIESYGQAVMIDPTKADAYLATAGVWHRLQEIEKSLATCDFGIQYAEEHKTEPWAQELGTLLEEGKRQILTLTTS